ncbi:MAG: cobalamin biosynthesis protein CobD [Magnetococcales bacterium]|nr:cobalamin biosynthesis protein CobD [Magnetococcales bacterium]
MDFSMLAVLMIAAIFLDKKFSEVRRFHPLVGFGNLANWLECLLYVASNDKKRYTIIRMRGVVAVIILVVPVIILCIWFSSSGYYAPFFSVLALYFALGSQSLATHANEVVEAMDIGGLEGARTSVAKIVSRDVEAMDEADIARSTIESVLENGCDAAFGALFWFLLLGAPGAVGYRLVNTLDAMWGYRNERYLHFGWAAAKLDDLLNYIPARLTALTYLLVGMSRPALRSWLQCQNRKSPNATLVMSTGAGALELKLGGQTVYDGVVQQNPAMGVGSTPIIADIPRAVSLVQRGIVLWSVVVLLIGVLVIA